MNRNIAFVLLAVAAVGQAFADDITIESTPFKSTASRQEVIAQIQAPGANPWADNYDQLAGVGSSSKSRDEVTAEYLASRDEVAAFTGEDSGSMFLAHSGGNGAHSTRVAALAE
jgi:hypothetical protein